MQISDFYVICSFLAHQFYTLFNLSQNANINNSMFWLNLSYNNNY